MLRHLLIIIVSLILSVRITAQVVMEQSVTRGKLVYNQYCMSCHQFDGGGVPNMNPPLAGSSWVAGDKRVLVNIVRMGFTQRVAIDGEYYSNNMPAQNNLTDQQVADVLTFIRNSFGNKASVVTISDVKKLNKKN